MNSLTMDYEAEWLDNAIIKKERLYEHTDR
jgi:hypothetical protein